MSGLWAHIAACISHETGTAFDPHPPSHLGGGCINTALRLSDGAQSWFVKTNEADRLDMFEAEAAGLDAMAATGTLRVPRPLCTGTHEGRAFIVMEYVDTASCNGRSQSLAGEGLAAMHRHTAERFGWQRDNTIGATHQPNAWRADWIDFWREQRLGFQLRLAQRLSIPGRPGRDPAGAFSRADRPRPRALAAAW